MAWHLTLGDPYIHPGPPSKSWKMGTLGTGRVLFSWTAMVGTVGETSKEEQPLWGLQVGSPKHLRRVPWQGGQQSLEDRYMRPPVNWGQFTVFLLPSKSGHQTLFRLLFSLLLSAPQTVTGCPFSSPTSNSFLTFISPLPLASPPFPPASTV